MIVVYEKNSNVKLPKEMAVRLNLCEGCLLKCELFESSIKLTPINHFIGFSPRTQSQYKLF